MIITRNNPRGGHPLKEIGCHLHEDHKGNFGILVGYVDQNIEIGEKILIRMSDAKEIAERFGYDLDDFKNRFKPKETLRQKIIRWLGGLPPSNAVHNF